MPDGTSDAADAATLTGPEAAWLGERADELDVSEEELLQGLVGAYRDLEANETDAPAVATAEDAASAVDVDAVEAQLADVEADFDEKIEDVRERVIQVKREANAKADADHEHAALSEQTRAAAEAARRLEDDYESLEAEVEELTERVDAGFENFQEVLSYLRDETDELNRKVTTVAKTLLSMRESVAALAGAAARRERVERLHAAANRAGVSAADCEECEQEVRVALLTEPECPFCSAAFEDVEAKSGWFGSHTLVTGEPPALEAADALLEKQDEESWLDEDAALEEMAEGIENESSNDDSVPEVQKND